MGQSTDGLLWFGMCWSDEDYEQGIPYPVQLYMARHLKIEGVPLEGKLDEGVLADLLEATGEDTHDEIEAELLKRLERTGCEFVFHCSGDYAMWGLALKKHNFRAWRGDPKELPKGFEEKPSPEDHTRLKRACERIGWPWTEPRWWLASNWG